MCNRPAVSRMTTGMPSSVALRTALWQTTTGSGAPRSEYTVRPKLFADDVQLIDGRGALQVGGDEHHLAAALLNQPAELAAGRGFAGALQAAQHEDAGRAGFEMERMIDRPHQVDELAMDDADQAAAWDRAN